MEQAKERKKNQDLDLKENAVLSFSVLTTMLTQV